MSTKNHLARDPVLDARTVDVVMVDAEVNASGKDSI